MDDADTSRLLARIEGLRAAREMLDDSICLLVHEAIDVGTSRTELVKALRMNRATFYRRFISQSG